MATAVGGASGGNFFVVGTEGPRADVEALQEDVLNGKLTSVRQDGLGLRCTSPSMSVLVPLANNPDQRVLLTVGGNTRALDKEEVTLASSCFLWGISSHQHLGDQQELLRQASDRLRALQGASA